jgi:hypothetical protein
MFWALWQAFPFVPAIGISRWTYLTSGLWSWRTVIETLLGFAVLRIALGNSAWLFLAYAMLPAQAFLLDRGFSAAALTGAAIGYVVAHVVGSRLQSMLGYVLLVWLIVEEFRPFQFVRDGHAFTWAPFGSWFAVADNTYYPVLFGKLYLYTSTVWALRLTGWWWKFAVGLPAIVLIFGEWAQQYIPGRTPESTDVVVLLSGAMLLKLCESRSAVRCNQKRGPQA